MVYFSKTWKPCNVSLTFWHYWIFPKVDNKSLMTFIIDFCKTWLQQSPPEFFRLFSCISYCFRRYAKKNYKTLCFIMFFVFCLIFPGVNGGSHWIFFPDLCLALLTLPEIWKLCNTSIIFWLDKKLEKRVIHLLIFALLILLKRKKQKRKHWGMYYTFSSF